jgi:hypothetical protein
MPFNCNLVSSPSIHETSYYTKLCSAVLLFWRCSQYMYTKTMCKLITSIKLHFHTHIKKSYFSNLNCKFRSLVGCPWFTHTINQHTVYHFHTPTYTIPIWFTQGFKEYHCGSFYILYIWVKSGTRARSRLPADNQNLEAVTFHWQFKPSASRKSAEYKVLRAVLLMIDILIWLVSMCTYPGFKEL